MAFESSSNPPSADCICRWTVAKVTAFVGNDQDETEIDEYRRLNVAMGCPVHEPRKAPKPTKCDSPRCSALILWAYTVKGVRMPVDAEPVDTGNITLTPRQDGEWQATVLTAAQTGRKFGATLYQAHLASCPDAYMYRRSRARR